MLFNSLKFLIFFPLTCLLYWLLPQRFRNPFLLVASYYFYMNWEPVYALLILFSTVTTWGASLLIDRTQNRRRRRLWLISCLIANLGILFVFKYLGFITTSVFNTLQWLGLRMDVPEFSILLPVGISFYTFQAVGYIADVMRRKIKPTRSLPQYALFVAFFPQLVAGPIERFQNLQPQFETRHIFNGTAVIEGLKLMLFGYFMKLCIADNVSTYVDAVYNNLPFHNGTSIILATFFFTFQIFGDFGGYSLIAIGSAKCMGFTLMQNFRQPYLATSPKDFWRRWHISLSSWFTEYVYIPLGGNRCSKKRHAFNTVATMLVSGLWHGANWTFVVWGGYHGVLMVARNASEKLRLPRQRTSWLSKFISICTTFVLVMAGWVFFRANSIADAATAFKKMATEHGMLYNGAGMPSILLALMMIGLLMIVEIYREYRAPVSEVHLSRITLARDIAYSAALVVVILLCGSFSGGQFIYFQF